MCFDDNSRPPIPVAENSGAHGETVQVEASDGTQVPAYLATPGGAAAAQIVILPDVRGLHQFYRELAMRFAENGVRALAIDYFGRTAQSQERNDAFEYMPHVQQMTQETFGSDVDAAVACLKSTGEDSLPVFSVGFCMGGSLSLWTGTRGLHLAGVIAFYASLSRTMGAVTPATEYASGSSARCSACSAAPTRVSRNQTGRSWTRSCG